MDDLHAKRERSREIAAMYELPPWLVDPAISAPRFRRVRWMLRRVWPV